MTKKQIIKLVCTILTAVVAALTAAYGLTSCNVTRTITTQSQYFQKGDTSVTITSKTVESYDGRKYNNLNY